MNDTSEWDNKRETPAQEIFLVLREETVGRNPAYKFAANVGESREARVCFNSQARSLFKSITLQKLL